MNELLKTKNAGKDSKTIQHALYDTGCSFEISRWEAATDSKRVVETIPYEGHADREAARAMAMGCLSTLHQLALHEIYGDHFVGKYGIHYYWAETMTSFVTIPED